MDKDAFLQSVNVDENLARTAWEQAGGDPEQARELLEPERIVLKGQFSDSDQGFFGLFMVDWSLGRTSLDDLNVIILGDDAVEDVDPGLRFPEFKSQIEQFQTHGSKMGGYTDQLENSLRKVWSNPQSDVRSALDSGEVSALEGLLQSFIAEDLELDELSLRVSIEQQRTVEKGTSSSESSSEGKSTSRSVEIPCQIEINPVRGVPVSQINPGDYIYVEPGEVESANQQVVDQLEKHREDNGMIPAKVVSKSSTPAGNLRIDIKFDQNVAGKVSCGKDVSILVPESTEQRLNSSGSVLGKIFQNELILGISLGLVLLVVLSIWFFLF